MQISDSSSSMGTTTTRAVLEVRSAWLAVAILLALPIVGAVAVAEVCS